MMQASSLLATDIVVVYMLTMAALYGLIDTVFVALQGRLLAWKALIDRRRHADLNPGPRASPTSATAARRRCCRASTSIIAPGEFVAIVGDPASASRPCCA